jgi:hypothetical protein
MTWKWLIEVIESDNAAKQIENKLSQTAEVINANIICADHTDARSVCEWSKW